MNESRRQRIENALWGLFVADALAMPVHWFYDRENIQKTFPGGITGYEAPPHPHPESFMVGMEYRPDVTKAENLGRPYDILHRNAHLYETTYSHRDVDASESGTVHGNATPRPEERYHYHHGLRRGENTVAAHLVRVLLRSVVEAGQYSEKTFIEDFVAYLTTPGKNTDPYVELYLRRWFENYSKGYEPRHCAAHRRDNWSIGSLGGMIRPMVLSLLAPSCYLGLGFAIEHQNLTHRSENVAAALGIAVPLLHELLAGHVSEYAADAYSEQMRMPRMNGIELREFYRRHQGPENVPVRKMWRIHTDLGDEPFNLEWLVKNFDDEDMIQTRLATACYPEHGLPLLLFLAGNHEFDVESTLLANVNAGGDNVHRGAVLGLLLGAANEEFPRHLIDGLADANAIAGEIEAFTDVAMSGYAW